MEKKKKQTKRSKAKYPGLEKDLFSRIKQEFFEGEDYAHLLSEKEKAFLAQFNDEFLGANLNPKSKTKYGKEELLHGPEYRKSIFDSNNARNRDIYSRARGIGALVFEDLTRDYEITEESLVELLDLKRELEKTHLVSSSDDSTDE